MWDSIVSIILFILSFSALIIIHELGHLSMAKLFKVYCKEYSIGFGPAIFSKKRKGGETKFSIRVVPLGGYVSMYGEGGEDDPEFKDLPPERSIEGIKKWKKAIILSAGVILNALLAFLLIFISNVAFPLIYSSNKVIVEESSLIHDAGVNTGDRLEFYVPSFYEEEGNSAFVYEFMDNDKIFHSSYFYIVDPNVTLADSSHYVLALRFNGNKNEQKFSDGILLYKAVSREEVKDAFTYDTQLATDLKKWALEDGSPNYYPNFEAEEYVPETDVNFTAHLKFSAREELNLVEINGVLKKEGAKTIIEYSDIGLSFAKEKMWPSFGSRMRNTFSDFGNAAGAVFKGLKILFTGGIRNMSGIVGIFDTSASLYANYAFSTYLYFWGLISINLAIFNLLPFPGLDGWQLLVTAIEGITRKKLPAKFKTIMSIIGLVLLFGLMIAIVVLDILRLVGI